jgi:hypothetical protein
MRRPHFGSVHYGTELPTTQQCLVGSACLNTWCGFPEFALKDVAEGLSSTPPSPIDIPIPDADESLEVDFYSQPLLPISFQIGVFVSYPVYINECFLG